MSERRQFGPYSVEITHPGKVLFPDDELTKGDLVDYYVAVADTILPHLRDRPVAMERWPDGIAEDGFYHRHAPEHFPSFVTTAAVQRRRDGEAVDHVLCDSAADLAVLANYAAITLHAFLARVGDLERPDRMVFDLDPPGDDFRAVRRAARKVRDLLDDLGLPSFAKLTGSRGLHVVTPLDRVSDFDAVRAFARDVAEVLAGRYPDELTVEQRKAKREGRLYLDVGRNAYGQLAVAPYSVRARSGAPVAAPIDWEELSDVDSREWTIRTVGDRLGERGDPWKGMTRHAHALDAPRERLDALLSDERT